MAKTVSEEEIQLRKRARRRLVGSVTLVILAVAILPMVLDSKPEKRSQEIDIRIPSEDAVDEFPAESAPSKDPLESAVPEKPGTKIKQEVQEASKSPEKGDPSASESVEKTGAVAGGSRSDAKTESGVAGPAVPTADTESFVVQLGAFSDRVKAEQQLQSLIAKDAAEFMDAKAYTETIKAGERLDKEARKGAKKSEITRVRVGPFRTREEAEGAHEKLKKLGFDGVVTGR